LHIVHKIYTHAHRERERVEFHIMKVHAQFQIYELIAELLLSELESSVIPVI